MHSFCIVDLLVAVNNIDPLNVPVWKCKTGFSVHCCQGTE